MTLPGEDIAELFDEVLERFCKKFIIESYANLKKGIEQGGFLLWNNKFKVDLKLIPTSDFGRIIMDADQEVYFYCEPHDFRRCKFSEIVAFVASLEPWDEEDIEIFDDSMKWVIIITHEDCTLLYGVDLKKER